MSRRSSLSRYNLIIKKLRRSSASFNEIMDYMERESELHGEDFVVSKRTFQRDLNDIRSLYRIDIQYDAARNVYFIDDDEAPEINERLLETFDTLNALNFTEGLSRYIHFEKRRPQGTENLYGLLHAIKNQLIIRFQYLKFWDDLITERIAEPYALKEFKSRWYLIAKDTQVKTFALDRLTGLEITKKRFSYPKDFSVNDLFRHSFGIISSNGNEPQEIILSFSPEQGKYIKTLPLHEHQETVVDNDEEYRIKLKLCITHDLLMELLSYGEELVVVAPESLRNEVRTISQTMAKYYEDAI